jgi:Xaa-Pro aminopeptidase
MSEFCPYTYTSKPPKLEYPWTFPMPSEKERDRRWASIRKSMNKHSIDCLIVGAPFGFMPNPNNHLYYISNYVPFFNLGLFIVFPREGTPQLGVSNDIGPQFLHTAMQTSWINEIVASFHPAKDIISKIKRLKLETGKIGIIGYRTGIFPASVYDALRESLPGAKFEDATSVLGEAINEVSRSSEEELKFLRKTCEILDASYYAVAAKLKPGVAEYELWSAAEQAIINNGGWYPHFMLAISGPDPTFLKAPPAHNKLVKGDVVIFEINVIHGGISAQICYALSLGKPKPELEKMFQLCKYLYSFALTELDGKRKFIDIETELANRIHSAGYEPMTPQIHIYNQASIMPMNSAPQPGDYFTVHPNMGNKAFTFGAKFGDTVRIARDGKVERLQKTPAQLNII